MNYKNPRVFNEMMYNFLFFANQGMDIIRIDAVPYIWKEMGTPCRNLPQVHTIMRMMRMIGEIVCPGVALLGEVVMEPEKAADSRYIHRGKFDWELAEKRNDSNTSQGAIFGALRQLEQIRRTEAVFDAEAEIYTKDYNDHSILWIVRRHSWDTLHAVFNFSDEGKTIYMPRRGRYEDLVHKETKEFDRIQLLGWSFVWLKEA